MITLCPVQRLAVGYEPEVSVSPAIRPHTTPVMVLRDGCSSKLLLAMTRRLSDEESLAIPSSTARDFQTFESMVSCCTPAHPA